MPLSPLVGRRNPVGEEESKKFEEKGGAKSVCPLAYLDLSSPLGHPGDPGDNVHRSGEGKRRGGVEKSEMLVCNLFLVRQASGKC